MPVITLEVAKEHLNAWLKAELAVSTAQSYRKGTKELTRADLPEIRKQINYWRNEVARLENGRRSGPRARRIIPRDL